MHSGVLAGGGLSGLLKILTSLHANGGHGILGIVYATAGSTYQKPGALILLDPSGMRHGAVSGGCLEPEIEERARRVSDNRKAEIIEFDTRSDEDLIFGSGTGCRGRISLMLLPQIPDAPLTQALARLVNSAAPMELLLAINGPHLGSGSATLGTTTWSWGQDGLQIPWHGPPFPQTTAAFVRVTIKPPPRIVLFGSGPETASLYLFTQQLGWSLTLVEHRGRWMKFARAAGVRNIIEATPDEAAPIWREQRPEAAVAMTHNYALDLQHLKACAETDLTYVGLLGPAQRRDQMLAELGEIHARRLEGRLHAPVGLTLGGRGPGPVALAITAELQQHFAATA